MITVYMLSDPRDGEVKYIGQTRDVGSRMMQHRSDETSSARSWILELDGLGIKPDVGIACQFEERDQALELERKLIRELCPPLNGGGGRTKTQFGGRISPRLRDQVRRLARVEGKKIAFILAEALELWLERHRGKKR